jgi:hypothetical protein
LFVATTTIRNVEPASPVASVYDDALEPADAQESPDALQRCQEIEKLEDGPAHAPGSADS